MTALDDEQRPQHGGLWVTLKEARFSLAMYWLLTLFGAVAMTVVVVATDDDPERDLHLLLIHLGLGGGMLLGNLVGLARPRAWVLWAIAALLTLVIYLLFEAEAPDEVTVPLVLGALGFFPATAVLLAHREIFAAWSPLLYSTGAILIWAEKTGHDDLWFQGEKWAIWDGPSLGILGGALFFFLLYLVARQLMVMRLWQLGPRSTRDRPTSPAAGLPWTTWFVGLALLAVLTGATAVAAPYLFRSAPGDREGDGGGADPDPYQPPDPNDPLPDGASDGLEQLVEQLRKVASQGLDWLFLLLGLVLTILGIRFLLYPPIRRVATLRHLEKPAWPVPSTRRIHDLWLRALVALADAGVALRPSEPPDHLAERACAELRARFAEPPPGLTEAVAIYERVEYNLAGLHKDDVTRMSAAVDLVVEYVDARIDRWTQVKNLYRTTQPWAEQATDTAALRSDPSPEPPPRGA